MRFIHLSVALCVIPGLILGNTYHVPNDYSLLQSAINAAGTNDTIICDTVKDLDTIKILNKVNLAVQGPSSTNQTTLTKVLLIENSSCDVKMLSFAGAKGLDGTNNNSCRSVPALDGRPGGDAILIDSSTVAVSGCTIRGGDGGSYGVSYQNTMLCFCGSKGTPGTALRANNSKISLNDDSLLSGSCAGTSIAGCFTTNCTVPGFGCVGLNGSAIDTIDSRIDTVRLDSTSTMRPMATAVKARYALRLATTHQTTFVSVAGRIAIPYDFKTPYTIHVYNAQGKLLWYKNNALTRRFELGSKPAENVYIVFLQ